MSTLEIGGTQFSLSFRRRMSCVPAGIISGLCVLWSSIWTLISELLDVMRPHTDVCLEANSCHFSPKHLISQLFSPASYSLRHLKYKDSSLVSSFDSLNISFHANWKVHVSLGHHRLFSKKLCPFLYYLSITPHFCHLRRRWFAHTL